MKKLLINGFIFIAIVYWLFVIPGFLAAQENLDAAINTLTDQINKYMVEQKKTKIAIIPFPDLQKQAVTVLGNFLAEELTTNLFTTGKFKIVERSLLKQVLDELKLGQTGIVDANSAKELGKMTGVDAIIAGTITDLGTSIAVNCRLIETQSGEVFAAAKARFIKDDSVSKLMIGGKTLEEKEAEKNIKPIEKEIVLGKPYVLDAREYVLDLVSFRIEFMSFAIDKTTLIKIFVCNNLTFSYDRVINMPTIIDENGNNYEFIKIIGDTQTPPRSLLTQSGTITRKANARAIVLPAKGKIPISFEFSRIPIEAKKILFTFMNQQIEIDWQELINKITKYRDSI